MIDFAPAAEQFLKHPCGRALAATAWTDEHQDFLQGCRTREHIPEPFLQQLLRGVVVRPQFTKEFHPQRAFGFGVVVDCDSGIGEERGSVRHELA